MGLLNALLAVGSSAGDTPVGRVHHECFRCGRNCTEADDRCPLCGGEVVVYQLD